MANFILKESQLQKLLETAMDLDIYVQPIDHPSSNGNESINSSIKLSIQSLKEIMSMFKTGKKVYPETENRIHELLDDINDVVSKIKEEI